MSNFLLSTDSLSIIQRYLLSYTFYSHNIYYDYFISNNYYDILNIYLKKLYIEQLYIINSCNIHTIELLYNFQYFIDQQFFNIYSIFCLDLPNAFRVNINIGLLTYPSQLYINSDIVLPLKNFVEDDIILINSWGKYFYFNKIMKNDVYFCIFDLILYLLYKCKITKKIFINNYYKTTIFNIIFILYTNYNIISIIYSTYNLYNFVFVYYNLTLVLHKTTKKLDNIYLILSNLILNYLVDHSTYFLTGTSCSVSPMLQKIRKTSTNLLYYLI